jgi:NTP pyrophosphatase (non-canonical NTP hydrolase)
MDKVKELQTIIREFAEKRHWIRENNGKDLALSISLEANELLECFQWKSSSEALETNLGSIKEELADVLIYCFRFADEHGLNIEELILSKLKKNAIKYPVL